MCLRLPLRISLYPLFLSAVVVALATLVAVRTLYVRVGVCRFRSLSHIRTLSIVVVSLL